MGCGGSKAVQVANQPNNAAPSAPPTNAPKTIVVASPPPEASKPVESEPSTPKAAPKQSSHVPANPKKISVTTASLNNSNKGDDEEEIFAIDNSGPEKNEGSPSSEGTFDSGVDAQEPKDEVDGDRPPTPELSIHGTRVGSATHTSNSQSVPRDTSAISTRSAPIVLERPASRGGLAFDINYDESPRRPDRLKKLELTPKKSQEFTLDDLQKKLAAADERRKDMEKRLKNKVATENQKVNSVGDEVATDQRRSLDELRQKADDKESKAKENREAHLRMLRDKLKAKEERAAKIREKKQQLQTAIPAQ